MTRLRDLAGIGPASERMLLAVGVNSPAQLDQLGSVAAYRRVLTTGARPSLSLLRALEGALLGLDWRELPAARKAELLDELDPLTQGAGAARQRGVPN